MKNRIKIQLTILFFAGITAGLVACATDPTYVVKKPFLYEARKGNSVTYIVGSLHRGVDVDDLPESFYGYFSKAEAFAVEADIRNISDAQTKKYTRSFMKTYLRNEKNKKIKDLLSAAEFARLKQILKKDNQTDADVEKYLERLSLRGIAAAIVEVQKTWVRGVPRGEITRHRQQFGMDRGLLKAAEKAKKSIYFLESTELPFKCYEFDDPDMLMRLKLSLQSGDDLYLEGTREYLKLVSRYRLGNEAELKKMAISNSDFDRCLLEDRNKTWMNKILSTHEAYNVNMVVVGVGHLITEKNSLLELLASHGFKVKRVYD